MSKRELNVVDSIRAVVARRMEHAEAELDAALALRAELGYEGTQEQREIAETRITIARDRIAELQTELIEADIIETETAVRTFERSAFASGGAFLQSAAGLADRVVRTAYGLRDAADDPESTEEELERLMRELDALGKALEGMAEGMEGVAENTEANADKERALKPETIPGGRLPPTVNPGPMDGPGQGGGGLEGGGGGAGGIVIINSNDNFAAGGDADAAGGAGFGGAGGTATSTATANTGAGRRRRRVGEIMLAVRVTAPLGDVNEGDSVSIEWTTEGGTAPRNATIELFAPETSQLHPADFHPIVQGTRDVGAFRWTVAVPQGHYTGLTISSPQSPVSLPGFYIRVTVTDASGQTASDTTPTFAIVRR